MTEQELIWSAVIAWMSSKGIEILKRIPGVPMDVNTDRINWLVARVVAVAATIGIHSTFDGAAGTLTITGLTWSGIFLAIGVYAKQLLLQEIAYKKFIRNGGH